MRKLFLLEDDLSLISGLTFAFKKQGFALDTARTLAEAEVLWSDRKYDLLVDRKSTRLNSSHSLRSRMPSSA